ncbi:hypothetical protein [Streptomyces jumonjinensis]|uniref:hypothetical protein n=1 Tax=Streptomyces jumonjinensis TaxID=1945 RepID=UPI0037983CEC
MHQKPDTAEDRTQERERRPDVSVPQVAGSALAAVAAAVLASRLGVYGTIIGAGVVSVVATSGGPLFQHLFSRTGEQIREVAVQTRPKARRTRKARRTPAESVPVVRPLPDGQRPYDGEFGTATTHGTRARGRRRPLLAAAVVFGTAMVGITGFELASGSELSGGGGGTTIGSVVRGGGGGSAPDGEPSHSPEPTRSPEERRQESPSPGDDRSGSPDGQRSEDGGTPSGPADSSRPGGGEDGGSGEQPGELPGKPGESTAPSTAPTPTPSGSATTPGSGSGSAPATGPAGRDAGAGAGTGP